MKKITFVATLCIAYVVSATAQKLEKIQTTSIWGPLYQRVYLDKSFQFQAFNPATDIFYTISNDKYNLYLQVQVKNEEVIEKAIKGGITFSISPFKNSDESFSIKYPLMTANDKVNLKTNFKVLAATAEAKKLQVDSFVRDVNQKINQLAKTFKLSKGKSKPDTVSIYNETGLRAISFIDNNLYYNYQLSIPFNILGKLRNSDSFSYNIALTGLQFGEFSKVLTTGIDRIDVINGQVKIEGPTASKITALINKTNLSGEYKLAKK